VGGECSRLQGAEEPAAEGPVGVGASSYPSSSTASS